MIRPCKFLGFMLSPRTYAGVYGQGECNVRPIYAHLPIHGAAIDERYYQSYDTHQAALASDRHATIVPSANVRIHTQGHKHGQNSYNLLSVENACSLQPPICRM